MRVSFTPTRVSIAVALTMALALSTPALGQTGDEASEAASGLTLEDVKRMSAAGLGDDVIVAKIEASDAVFNLAVDEILQLKRDGVSDRVLAALVRTGVIQKHYSTRRVEESADDRHAVSGDVIVERHYPTYVYTPRRYVYPRVRFGYSYGYPWYGYYTYPWPYNYSGYYGYGHSGHGGYYGGHYGGHQGSSHGGHYGNGGANYHGGHKPVLGTRTSVGGRGGRR